MKENNRRNLKDTLTKSTEKCFELMDNIIQKESEYYNVLVLLKKEYFDGKSDRDKNTISFENWQSLSNSITDRILKLIDNIENPENSHHNIAIEENNQIPENAIKWLKKNLHGIARSTLTETMVERGDRQRNESKYLCKNIEIENDGSFVIHYDVKERSESYREKDNFLRYYSESEIEYIVSGNFVDIDAVQFMEVSNNTYRVDIFSKDIRFVFHEKSEHTNKRWGETDEKEIIDKESLVSNVSSFYISLDNLGLGEKIKNCIEFISNYYKNNKGNF